MVAGSPVAGDPVAVRIKPLVVGADDGAGGAEHGVRRHAVAAFGLAR
jgi:hypothetical protein